MGRNIYNYKGDLILNEFIPSSYDMCVKGVAHRGYSSVAPENTIPSYILACKKGFKYVETDVCLTSDGVFVLLHDSTIDRTSDGTGNIADMTYAQVRQYDFGSWKSEEYTGVKIPTLEEFLQVCRKLMLCPYIEVKHTATFTQAQVENIVDLVYKYGLGGKATFMSFSSTYLNYIKTYDETARLGWPSQNPTSSDLTTCQSLLTGKNSVFFDPPHTVVTDSMCDTYRAAGIPIEVWTIDDEETVMSLNPYISAVTSNSLHAGRVLYDSVLK